MMASIVDVLAGMFYCMNMTNIVKIQQLSAGQGRR